MYLSKPKLNFVVAIWFLGMGLPPCKPLRHNFPSIVQSCDSQRLTKVRSNC